MDKKVGFTLIELIIVLAIIATLVAILITVVKPQQIFMNMRDTRRQADLNNLSKAIDIYQADIGSKMLDIVMTPSGTSLTIGGSLVGYNSGCVNNSTPTIFYSTKNVNGTTTNFSGARATNSQLIATSIDNNPPGWLPVPIGTSSILNLQNLPLDPRNIDNASDNNKSSFYYTFACKADGSYELNANLENPNNNLEANDGGNNSYLYEVGPDKTILPAVTSTNFYPNL